MMSIDYTSFSNDEIENISSSDFSDVTEDVLSNSKFEEDISENEIENNSSKNSEDIMLKVANCEKVYIREKPDQSSSHIAIVSNGSDLLVIGNSVYENDELWHNVCTESGAEGYIMAKFTVDTQ